MEAECRGMSRHSFACWFHSSTTQRDSAACSTMLVLHQLLPRSGLLWRFHTSSRTIFPPRGDGFVMICSSLRIPRSCHIAPMTIYLSSIPQSHFRYKQAILSLLNNIASIDVSNKLCSVRYYLTSSPYAPTNNLLHALHIPPTPLLHQFTRVFDVPEQIVPVDRSRIRAVGIEDRIGGIPRRWVFGYAELQNRCYARWESSDVVSLPHPHQVIDDTSEVGLQIEKLVKNSLTPSPREDLNTDSKTYISALSGNLGQRPVIVEL